MERHGDTTVKAFSLKLLVILLLYPVSYGFKAHYLYHSFRSSSAKNVLFESSPSQINDYDGVTTTCERITSKHASTLIHSIYKNKCDSNILLVTTDASRGANRHTGIASIIREICVNDNDMDNVTVATRRINSVSSRNIFESEVSALAFGVKIAVQNLPVENYSNVLILTDSTSAISFYCGDENGVKTPNIDHENYRYMNTLIQSVDNVFMAKVRSAKSGKDGFFDHDVSDILSSFVKTKSNKEIEQSQSMINSQCEKETANNPIWKFRYSCHRLRESDLSYLKSSTSSLGNITSNGKTQLYLKRVRGKRLERCRTRILEELCINLNN